MKWYIYAIRKFAVFSGRARRKEFWYFYLFNFLIGTILGLLTLLPNAGKVFGLISIIYSLFIFIPTLAVCVRRLHDINYSGFYIFMAFIPFAGIIIMIIYLSQDSYPNENKYGLNPKNFDTGTETKRNNINKILIISFSIAAGIILMILFYYFAFKSLSSTEMLGITNMSNNKYYLEVVTDKSKSQFSLKRYVEINGVKYSFILKTGKYKLSGPENIYHCKRNDDIDVFTKIENIYDVFKIIDDKNNIIWDMNDEDLEIMKIEGPLNIILWSISIE